MLAVIRSPDQYVFAVARDTGITRLEETGKKPLPLRISLRGQEDHCLHVILDHVVAAAGFSLGDIESWCGGVIREGMIPHAGGVRFSKLEQGDVDAIFDEAVAEWLEDALDREMAVLSLQEDTVRKLEAMGYRRSTIRKGLYARHSREAWKARMQRLRWSGAPLG